MDDTARKCKTCIWFKEDWGTWCFNGWSKDGRTGYCHYEPQAISKSCDDVCSQHLTHLEANTNE